MRLFTVVVYTSDECWTEWGVSTYIHSDAQVSRVSEWGFESVRDSETWVERRYCSFEQDSVASSTPLARKGCVASNLPNATFGLDLLFDLRD